MNAVQDQGSTTHRGIGFITFANAGPASYFMFMVNLQLLQYKKPLKIAVIIKHKLPDIFLACCDFQLFKFIVFRNRSMVILNFDHTVLSWS